MKQVHKIIVKKPGENLKIIDFNCKFRNECGMFIGEDITKQYVSLSRDLIMIIDEDGLSKQLPLNFFLEFNNPYYPIQAIVGTVVFVKIKYVNPCEKEIWDFEVDDVSIDDIAFINKLLDAEHQKYLAIEFMS